MNRTATTSHAPAVLEACAAGDLPTVQQANRLPPRALHAAALYGRIAVCRWLLEHSCDPLAPVGPRHETPLHAAARSQCPATVRALLAHAASADPRNDQGDTPLAIALAPANQTDPRSRSQAWACGRLLIQAGADPWLVSPGLGANELALDCSRDPLWGPGARQCLRDHAVRHLHTHMGTTDVVLACQQQTETRSIHDALAKHFGVTDDLREAGWILPDGRLLDLTGRHQMGGYVLRPDGRWQCSEARDYQAGHRVVDHREVPASIIGEHRDGGACLARMFVLGCIRMDARAGTVHASLCPSGAQWEHLRNMAIIHDGALTVDIDRGGWHIVQDMTTPVDQAQIAFPAGTRWARIQGWITRACDGSSPQASRSP